MEIRRHPTIRVSIILIMLFQVSALLIRSFVQQKMGESGIEATTGRHLSAVVGFAVLTILMWPLLRGQMPAIRCFFERPSSWLKLIACSVGIGLLLRLMSWAGVIGLLSIGIPNGIDPTSATASMFWWICPTPAAFLSSVLVMSVLTPLIEEFINRGLVLHTLIRKNLVTAILGSAFFFAVLHPISNVTTVFLTGIVLAMQMVNQKTLWGTVIAHSTYNLLAILDSDCLNGLRYPEVAMPLAGIGSLVLLLASLSGAVLLAKLPGVGAVMRPDPETDPS